MIYSTQNSHIKEITDIGKHDMDERIKQIEKNEYYAFLGSRPSEVT